eukprot:1160914-Pelagomonas_calceolata.AAC.24
MYGKQQGLQTRQRFLCVAALRQPAAAPEAIKFYNHSTVGAYSVQARQQAQCSCSEELSCATKQH